jgi:hypothetical protein
MRRALQWQPVLRRELQVMARDRRLRLLAACLAALLLAALASGVLSAQQWQADVAAAGQQDRQA